MTELRLDLGEPRAGWISVTLQIGSHTWQGPASWIVDSLTALVDAALALLEHRDACSAIVFHEPDASRIAFVTAGDHARVIITHHPELAPAQTGQDGAVLLEASAPRVELARAIWRALRRLESTGDVEQIEREWRRPLPRREIEQLGKRLG